MKIRNAEIITVGGEYADRTDRLSGSDIFARILSREGIAKRKRVSFPVDDPELEGEIARSIAESDLTVIVSAFAESPRLVAGMIARALGVRVVPSETMFAMMHHYEKKRGHRLTDDWRESAVVPEGAKVYEFNKVPVPPYIIELDVGKRAVIVALGNFEAISVMCENVFAGLFSPVVTHTRARVGIVKGGVRRAIGEAHRIAEEVEGVSARVYVPTAEVVIELDARGDSEEQAKKRLEKALHKLKKGELADKIYGVDTGFAEEIVRRLRERGEKLALAESCTGGLVAKMITDVPGSSDVFPGGVVSYSNDVKNRFLGVRMSSIAEHGAVSHRVAIQMASGARSTVAADWGVGITGIAGPGGGTEEKPVGLVYVAVSNEDDTSVIKYNLSGDRMTVRNTVAKYALRELLIRIMQEDKK